MTPSVLGGARQQHTFTARRLVLLSEAEAQGDNTPSAIVSSCLRVGAALSVATYSRVMPADGCVTCCAHLPAARERVLAHVLGSSAFLHQRNGGIRRCGHQE